MAKKINSKAIEAVRRRQSRAERREQQKQIMQEDIERNQDGKGVVVIPPKIMTGTNESERQLKRVAAYCRVSTQEENQVSSFEMQVKHAEERINGNPNWTLVDIRAHEPV